MSMIFGNPFYLSIYTKDNSLVDKIIGSNYYIQKK